MAPNETVGNTSPKKRKVEEDGEFQATNITHLVFPHSGLIVDTSDPVTPRWSPGRTWSTALMLHSGDEKPRKIASPALTKKPRQDGDGELSSRVLSHSLHSYSVCVSAQGPILVCRIVRTSHPAQRSKARPQARRLQAYPTVSTYVQLFLPSLACGRSVLIPARSRTQVRDFPSGRRRGRQESHGGSRRLLGSNCDAGTRVVSGTLFLLSRQLTPLAQYRSDGSCARQANQDGSDCSCWP